MNYVFSSTGKYPVISGGDFLYPGANGSNCCTGTTSRAQAWWNAGGIPMLCYHMGAPPLADTFANSETATPHGINAVLNPTDTTGSYASFLAKLDYAAAQLQVLQAANVAVVWRPFHEAGGTWFWWSMEGGAQYIRLWQFMYNYFTVTKGLHNLIWMHPFDGSPPSAFYPGKAFVDIGGGDTYATNEPFSPLFTAVRSIVGSSLPIALHENGLMPQPASMFGGNAAPWLLFNTWAGFELPPGSGNGANTLASLQAAYADPHTVTRDEVPSLK